MLELLKLIFSDIWVWTGFVILVCVIFCGIAEIVKACKRSRRVTAYRIGGQWHIQIENASREDTITAMYAPETLTGNEGSKGNENA